MPPSAFNHPIQTRNAASFAPGRLIGAKQIMPQSPIHTFALSLASAKASLSQRPTSPTAINSLAMDINSDPVSWTPLYLSTIAGFSTCIGAAIVFFLRKGQVSPNMMSFSLALAGSVMVTVSVVSIGPECLHGMTNGWVIFERISSTLLGCGLYFLLAFFALPEPDEILGFQPSKDESLIPLKPNDVEEAVQANSKEGEKPSVELTGNPNGSKDDDNTKICPTPERKLKSGEIIRRRLTSGSELSSQDEKKDPGSFSDFQKASYWSGADLQSHDQRRAWRVAILLFLSLLIHNFPEGLAVAASAVQSPTLGITVTIGIMIHNIPEGIAIAVPCLAARPNQPWLAFALASVSGLAEPLGAFIALLVLRSVGHGSGVWSLENVLAFVAGIMTTVALYELFPEGKRHSSGWAFWLGTLSGFIVMVTTEYIV